MKVLLFSVTILVVGAIPATTGEAAGVLSATYAPCAASALSLSTSIQGAAGHREGSAVFRNHSAKACVLAGRPAVELFDAAGRRLQVKVAPGPTHVYDVKSVSAQDKRLGIVRPGYRAFVALRWGNFCGKAKLPISLVVTMGRRHDTLSAPMMFGPASKPTPVDAPPCLGPTLPSTLDVGPYVVVSQAAQP
jgi:Protein of unknown function (DUF4232)